MNEDIPSKWQAGYTHRAEIECWSCDGTGEVQGYRCGICNGKKVLKVGCGGAAEVDPLHAAIGAYCLKEQMTVPMEDVSR